MVWRDATKLAQTWLSFLQCSQNSTVVCTVTVTEPQGQRDIANANADSQEADAADENAEIVEVLNDVEALLGEPIFITNWIREWRNKIVWIFHLQRWITAFLCVYLIKFANIVTNYVNLSPSLSLDIFVYAVVQTLCLDSNLDTKGKNSATS